MRRTALPLVFLVTVTACADADPRDGRVTPKEYAIPSRMLSYSYAGGAIKPIPNTPLGTVPAATP